MNYWLFILKSLQSIEWWNELIWFITRLCMVCDTLKSVCNYIDRYKIAMYDLKIHQMKCKNTQWLIDSIQMNHIPNVMKFDRDSTAIGPLPQKYVPRSKIWLVPSSSTRNCSVLQSFPSPLIHTHIHKKKPMNAHDTVTLQMMAFPYRNSNIYVTIQSNHIIAWTFNKIAARWARIIIAQISKIAQNANISTRINHRCSCICIQSDIIITTIEIGFLYDRLHWYIRKNSTPNHIIY